jgi:hypothetical protein
MKIYLSVEKPEISGYNNIDLSKYDLDLAHLDTLCEPAECIEMVLDEVVHYITLQQIPALLQRLATRLRKSAKMIVYGYDINECIKMYQNGRMSIADINLILYGTKNIRKTSCISYVDIKKILETIGLQIVSIELSSEKFIIIAQRG